MENKLSNLEDLKGRTQTEVLRIIPTMSNVIQEFIRDNEYYQLTTDFF